MNITAFDLAERFLGTEELAGSADNPQIMAMLNLDASWPEGDEVPWCSGFVNWVCWLLRLPRTKSLLARSWLTVGSDIPLDSAQPGFDVVVLKRGKDPQPGPEDTTAPGHVGFYWRHDGYFVELLGGNQGNKVSIASFERSRILSVRRLYVEAA